MYHECDETQHEWHHHTNCEERSQKDHNRLTQISTGKNSACISNNPHSITGNTPAKLLLGRNLHTRLDFLKPNTAAHVESKQWNQEISHDNLIPASSFTVGQSVLIHVHGQNHKWTHGSILKSTGPLS